MRKTLLGLTVIAIASLPLAASAQPEGSRSTIELNGAVDVPLGDFADGAGVGVDVGGLWVYALHKQFKLTGGVDVIYHFDKNSTNLLQVPVMAGFRFHINPKVFLFGQIGLNIARISGGGQSQTDTELAARAGGGYDIGPIDIFAALMFSRLDEAGESMQVIAGIQLPILSL